MVVYDFDNTIYDGESAVDFFLYCLKRKKSLIRYMPIVFYYALLYKLKFLTIDHVYKAAGKVAKAFIKNTENMEEIVKDFWKKHEKNLKDSFLTSIQPNDVIISASPYFLIDGIRNRLNTKNMLCSIFNVDNGTFEFICYRENKVKILLEKFPDAKIERLYTDSLNDKPLMDLAKETYLIQKKKEPLIIKNDNV